MSFVLQKTDVDGDQYTFTFIDDQGTYERLVDIEFEHTWQHGNIGFLTNVDASFCHELRKKNEKTGRISGVRLGESIPFALGSESTDAIMQEELAVFPISIPDKDARELTMEALRAWGYNKNCPIDVNRMEHPMFPLLRLVYNHHHISKKNVRELIASILGAIANATIETNQKEQPEEESEESMEPFPDIDDAVDYEPEDDLDDLGDEGEMEDYAADDMGEVIMDDEEEEND